MISKEAFAQVSFTMWLSCIILAFMSYDLVAYYTPMLSCNTSVPVNQTLEEQFVDKSVSMELPGISSNLLILPIMMFICVFWFKGIYSSENTKELTGVISDPDYSNDNIESSMQSVEDGTASPVSQSNFELPPDDDEALREEGNNDIGYMTPGHFVSPVEYVLVASN